MKDVRIGDFVCIDERAIEKKVVDLMRQNKNKIAHRWRSYANVTFRVDSFDENNLAVLVDALGNEIHISKKALYFSR